MRGEDLHPDDATTRNMIRLLLMSARRDQRLGQRTVAARLGRGQSNVSQLEHRTHWLVATVQQWARAVGWRLVLTPMGLPDLSGDGDQYAAVLARIRPTSAVHTDELARARLRNDLVRARRLLRIRHAAMAEVLGCSARSVGMWETSAADSVSLPAAQRYARALGGAVWVGLEPDDGSVR